MDEGDPRPSGNDLEASYRLGGSDPTSQIAQAVMVADRPLSGSTWLTVLFWLGSGKNAVKVADVAEPIAIRESSLRRLDAGEQG